MADDQVKYSDLFDAGIIGEVQKLTNEITSLKNAIAAAKTEANGLRDNLRGAGTATREQQQQIAADAAATEEWNKQVKDLTDKLAKLEERKKRYSKLNKEETASVEALRQALAGEAQEQIKATQAIDIHSKSYNELYQTYNALKDALNKMTVAERENSQAGKEMVNRAKEIRDTLNNLQQATGNYTLNVGNYMSALNGLQFQTQQLLREIPSAQNLTQFFLAISNNIPMFADALARYNQGLPEIKAKLAAVTAEITRQTAAMAAMNAQSTEYAAAQARLNELQRQQQQLQGASVSGWRAILKAVGSWQTLLIAGLLVLRKVPEWIKKARDRARELAKEWKNIEVSERAAMAQLQMDITKATAETRNELDLIINKMGALTQGSQEWQNSVKRINELTNGTLDAVSATPEQIRKVTQAYLDQEKQLATNRSIIGQLSAFDLADRRKSEIRSGVYTAEEIALLAGKVGDDKFIERAQRYLDARKNFQSQRYKELEKARNKAAYGSRARSRIQKEMNKLAEGYTSFDRELDQLFVSGSQKARNQLMSNYVALDEGSIKGGSTPRQAKDPVADLLTLQRELIDAQLENIREDYERLKALENERHRRFVEDKEKELELVNGDPKRTAVINQQIEEEQKTHFRKMLDLHEKQEQELAKLREAEERENKEAAQKRYNAISHEWEQERTKLVEQKKTRKELIQAELDAEIARLNVMLELERSLNGEMMSDEEKAKIQEWIKMLNQLKASGDFRGLKLGQLFGKGASGLGGERNKSGNYSNIIDLLFGDDMSKDQQSALSSVFDQAKAALNSWMDARKAAADQAKELADDEVSAAENALNREIELRNQGYANDVALREKELANAKETQKKAAEEQKKIAQQQVLLDAAMQTSSMITASANIMKQFPNPALWIPMLATMWSAFSYAKIKAYQASTKSIKFKEGGVMLLDGGSHESGHDVGLGIGPDGSNLRAEGGEYFAVINKRNSRKYGREIPAVVNALNSGMFDEKYIKTSDAAGMMGAMVRMGGMGHEVDMSKVEAGVDELVKQGETTYSVEGEYMVIRYKNLTRRVRC